jgi:MoaA/NifB/PqqE/SkfB family radical SAM enzyme
VSIVSRIRRHTELSRRAREHREHETPPFLIVFINSICNLTCEHCFYWKELNKRNDLTFAEFEQLTSDLGQFDTLNLSGGEPFIRQDFGEICGLFITKNGVKQIYVPTNGYFTDKCERSLRKVLQHKTLDRFVCEISLDGMPEYHNRFRGNPKSFEKAMETYAMLAKLQDEDPRLRIHVNTVAMGQNIGEVWRLTEYMHDNYPRVEHHNLAVIRGDRKNPSLTGPALEQYKRLYDHVREVWSDREKGRFGSSVEPMLQYVKVKTMEGQSQFVPCKAGILSGVVYANGDVSVCETHAPLGNLRQKRFFEIWDSPEAKELRAQIKAKECFCTNEVFMWPSIVFQPVQLTRAYVGANVRVRRSSADETVPPPATLPPERPAPPEMA